MSFCAIFLIPIGFPLFCLSVFGLGEGVQTLSFKCHGVFYDRKGVIGSILRVWLGKGKEIT